METITITVEEYEKLKADSEALRKIEAKKYENWDGYCS